MSERYKKIITIDDRYWNANSPVEILKGALLYDAVKERNLLQLKFKQITSRKLIAFTLHINCYELGKTDACESLDYQFLDLIGNRGNTYGADRAIYLDSVNARTFDFAVKDIVYQGNDVDNNVYKMIPVPSPQRIDILGRKKEAFKSLIPDAVFVPSFNEQYWVCTCGEINSNVSKSCRFCMGDKERLAGCMDNDRLEKETKELEEEKDRLQKEKDLIKKQKAIVNKKRRIRIMTGVLIVLMIVFLFKTYNDYLKPRLEKEQNYKSAIELIQEGRYEEAESILQKLDGYKESYELEEQIDIYKIKKAVADGEYIPLPELAKFGNGDFLNSKILNDKQLEQLQYFYDCMYDSDYDRVDELIGGMIQHKHHIIVNADGTIDYYGISSSVLTDYPSKYNKLCIAVRFEGDVISMNYQVLGVMSNGLYEKYLEYDYSTYMKIHSYMTFCYAIWISSEEPKNGLRGHYSIYKDHIWQKNYEYPVKGGMVEG